MLRKVFTAGPLQCASTRANQWGRSKRSQWSRDSEKRSACVCVCVGGGFARQQEDESEKPSLHNSRSPHLAVGGDEAGAHHKVQDLRQQALGVPLGGGRPRSGRHEVRRPEFGGDHPRTCGGSEPLRRPPLLTPSPACPSRTAPSSARPPSLSPLPGFASGSESTFELRAPSLVRVGLQDLLGVGRVRDDDKRLGAKGQPEDLAVALTGGGRVT